MLTFAFFVWSLVVAVCVSWVSRLPAPSLFYRNARLVLVLEWFFFAGLLVGWRSHG